jgi:DNA-binding response OmpR family regulator
VNFYDYCGSGRILVVDDHAPTRELLALRLGVIGYHVQTTDNGRKAMERIYSFKPDAVICDLNMPELDGFGLLERLGPQRLAYLPVMMLTASHTAADVQRAISLGARDFLAKPFDERQLFRRVARLLRKRPANAAGQLRRAA